MMPYAACTQWGVNMIKKSKVATGLLTFVASAALVLGSATAAQALTSVSAEGGTFEYGVEKFGGNTWIVKSHYYHKSKKHRTTACSAYTNCVRSADVAGGYWSKVGKVFGGESGAKAYYYVY